MLLCLGNQVVEIGKGSEKRINVFVVAYVIARVFLRGLEEGRAPDRIDVQLGQCRQTVGDALKVTHAVTIAIGKASWVNLVNDA